MSRKITLASYDRWGCERHVSWPFRVFNQYHFELQTYAKAVLCAQSYTYKKLGQDNAEWQDLTKRYFPYNHNDNKLTIRQWSDSFHEFENWFRLNQLMSMCSYFETYLTSIIKLSIESNPGLMLNAPRSIDGIRYLKYNIVLKTDTYDGLIEDCTRGDWNSRLSAFNKLFGSTPDFMRNNVGELEKIRVLRNKVGHAFGRDIEKSRDYNLTQKLNIERLGRNRFIQYRKLLHEIASRLDKYMMFNYVGNFQPISFYHAIKDNKPLQLTSAMYLKKCIQSNANELFSKEFCKWIVSYYDWLP